MGYGTYSVSNRFERATTAGFSTKPVNDIFEQNKLLRVHESMSSKNIKLRESNDSEAHPNTIPIILGLDVTGSMRKIPHQLIQKGLPTLMSNLIQKGATDASLLFLAIGDHEYDTYPLQVGQFESGDKELDMWLTRTYLEGGGGGNAGESYFLAHYFAARHTRIDSFDKRKTKGFLFTVGDEPFLKTIPASAIREIMGDDEGVQGTINYEDILKECQEKYNVFHIHVLHSDQAKRSFGVWKELLGENCIGVENYENIPNVIAETVIDHSVKNMVIKPNVSEPNVDEPNTTSPGTDKVEILL